jgi:Fe-S-cluster-containing dehydrogenase component
MEKKLAMVIDSFACIDCKACQAACKEANGVPTGQWRNWIKRPDTEAVAKRGGRMLFQPGNCMQCDKPICVEACPTGATYKDPLDGTVRIDRKLCIGCGQCLPACPYGARYRDAQLKVADKCDFCAERRLQGLSPACVSTCPNKARAFGDLYDPKSDVRQLLEKGNTVQVVNADSNTDPNIYYVGDPGVKDWPVKAQMPPAFAFWKNLAGPAMKGFVGLSALGVSAMLVKQFVMPNDAPAEKDEGGDEHG